jgi:hypothetical protein
LGFIKIPYLCLVNNDELFGYIGKLKDHDIQFKLREISEGDSYSSEQGAEYLFQILGNKYSVGYVYIIEDQDDWAQAESHESNWCYCNDEHINPDKVYKLIENYKSVVRDNKLNELGI